MPVQPKMNFENKKLYDRVVKMFDFAKTHRDAMTSNWRNSEDLLYGNHWKHSKMPRYKSKITSNAVFEAIETIVPIITARAPKLEVLPNNEQSMEYSEMLERQFDHYWRMLKMNRKIREAFRNMMSYGNGFMKSTMDPYTGEIAVDVVDVFTAFPDPYASSLRECEKTYFIHAPVMYVSDVKRVFGVDIAPEGNLDEFRSLQWKEQVEAAPGGGGSTIKSPIGDTNNSRVETLEEQGTGGYAYSTEQALIIECWYYDDSVEEIPETITMPDGSVVESESTMSMPKYPEGRVTIIARSEKDKILFDGPNPYGRLPFFMSKNYSESGSFWGRSEASQVESLMKAENMIISQIVDNIRLTANPQRIVSKSSGIRPNELNNEPGNVVSPNAPGLVAWETPPPMPNYVLSALQYLDAKIDNMTGVQDAYRGKSASSTESGRHAQILRMQTVGRLQPKMEEITEMIQDIAEHWAYIITEMMDQPITQRVKDDAGQMGFQTTDPSDMRAQGISSNSFDYEIAVGSTLPHDQQAEFQETMMLAQAGMVPPEMVIDASQFIRDKGRAKDFVRQAMSQEQAGGDGAMANLTPEEQQIMQGTDEDAINEVLMKHPEILEAMNQAQPQ